MTSVNLSEIVSPAFYDLHRQIKVGKLGEVICKGGRGSTKSSFLSVELILLLLRRPDCHAVVLRKVEKYLRKSVYAQILWAISALGLSDKFRHTVSPMEITYIQTGQKILFLGLDNPENAKSIKLPFGYIGMVWFEELNQFAGPEEVRSVIQSTLRGGDYGMIMMSFNPPAAGRNWVNRYALEAKAAKTVHHSTYLTTPPQWLGPKFLQEADNLKEKNPTAYLHEYLGEVVGNGTQVFDNLRLEAIGASQIGIFDRVISGVDWGWYPDPWAFNRTHYDAARRTLYLFDEMSRHKTNNFETAALVKERIPQGEQVIADSAELKSCADYADCGIRCLAASKGPGSVNQSMKWLQSLTAIVIDPVRCPETAKEFSEYEYETSRDGEVLSGYPDCDNHHIDAVRYATNKIWIKKGT